MKQTKIQEPGNSGIKKVYQGQSSTLEPGSCGCNCGLCRCITAESKGATGMTIFVSNQKGVQAQPNNENTPPDFPNGNWLKIEKCQ